MRFKLHQSILILGKSLALLLCLGWIAAQAGQKSNLKPEQEVVFYPSICHCVDGKNWELEIHGSVYEPDKRNAALAFFRELLALNNVHLNGIENTVFAERVRMFMVDHK